MNDHCSSTLATLILTDGVNSLNGVYFHPPSTRSSCFYSESQIDVSSGGDSLTSRELVIAALQLFHRCPPAVSPQIPAAASFQMQPRPWQESPLLLFFPTPAGSGAAGSTSSRWASSSRTLRISTSVSPPHTLPHPTPARAPLLAVAELSGVAKLASYFLRLDNPVARCGGSWCLRSLDTTFPCSVQLSVHVIESPNTLTKSSVHLVLLERNDCSALSARPVHVAASRASREKLQRAGSREDASMTWLHKRDTSASLPARNQWTVSPDHSPNGFIIL